MLRNVLEGYVAQATERQVDLPFLLLLPAMGFYDVHYTHGSLEFGKDFIAKRKEDGEVVQYVFQTKAGVISLSEWRAKISGQMLSALFNPIRHPNLDSSLRRHVILVTTGDLSEHASIEFQGMQSDIAQNHPQKKLTFWAGSNLIDFLEEYGLNGIHKSTIDSFTAQGQFFLRYSQALDGSLKSHDIEEYSRFWAVRTDDLAKQLLWASIEAEVLSQQCLVHERYYEALQTQLALLRVICALSYSESQDFVLPLYIRCLSNVERVSEQWIALFREDWDRERGLSWMMVGTFPFLAYPVQCARLVEATALIYFNGDDEAQEDLADFLADFVIAEPGCSHPVSDRYAVHLVLATLILYRHGKVDIAKNLINDTVVWICERHSQGAGLAGFEANEVEETRQLLGYAVEGIPVEPAAESLLSTVCCDLAAFIGDPEFYADVVNDTKSCEIAFSYWQPSDTAGSCFIEAADIVGYPNVEYRDELPLFEEISWAEHVATEPGSFVFTDVLGMNASVAMIVLLRERFFFKLWPELAAKSVTSELDLLG